MCSYVFSSILEILQCQVLGITKRALSKNAEINCESSLCAMRAKLYLYEAM